MQGVGPDAILQRLTAANESIWTRMGTLYEQLNESRRAEEAYENALRHNPYSTTVLKRLAAVNRAQKQTPKAIEHLLRLLDIDNNNGEAWSELGHCYLMTDELQKAYTAYQNALYNLQNPKDTKLWYGIGILYDRYGSCEHAEEAFTAVLKIEPAFEKSSEIRFRLGIIYKQQNKYDQSLNCFKEILTLPPPPLTEADIWFQIGHVHELKKEFDRAKESYERVLKVNANHAKVLQQLGWLYHHNQQWGNQERAISYLTRSIDADPSDGQTWYLLGRCYMTQQKYRKAYDAYQQAVYRDGRNPTFWCSIGVLYYQINQYRDALDAYSRAIQLNPFLSEVWYDLGTLYESCKQLSDSLDAYQRAAQLDPRNEHIQERLAVLRATISQGNDGKDGDSQPAGPKPMPAEPKLTNNPPGLAPVGGMHGGPPGGMQGEMPGGMPGPMPGMPGSMPGMQGGMPGSMQGGMPGMQVGPPTNMPGPMQGMGGPSPGQIQRMPGPMQGMQGRMPAVMQGSMPSMPNSQHHLPSANGSLSDMAALALKDQDAGTGGPGLRPIVNAGPRSGPPGDASSRLHSISNAASAVDEAARKKSDSAIVKSESESERQTNGTSSASGTDALRKPQLVDEDDVAARKAEEAAKDLDGTDEDEDEDDDDDEIKINEDSDLDDADDMDEDS